MRLADGTFAVYQYQERSATSVISLINQQYYCLITYNNIVAFARNFENCLVF